MRPELNNDLGICTFTAGKSGFRCDRPADRICSKSRLCDRHYRLSQMRYSAKAADKFVPSFWQLELLVPADMKCPKCANAMIWAAGPDRSRRYVISLQHYADGTIALECMACNIAHGHTKHRSEHTPYIEGRKWCCSCRRSLPTESFAGNRSKPGGLQAYCRACTQAKKVLRYDAANSYRRERWVKRKLQTEGK
jgi:hypothetical protein